VDETTSLLAAAVACSASPDDLEILNPELRRGITPPGLGSYTLKVPTGKAEAFARNIMVARIEHPAVVRSDRQIVKKTYKRNTGSKYASKAGKSRTSKSKGASTGKTVVAKGPQKKAVQTASVQKSKASRQSGAAPVMASMLASPHSGKSKSITATGKSASKTAGKASPSKVGKKKVSSATSKPVRTAANGAGKPAKKTSGTMLISKR
jgi:membrane-bound lytic murein transglycosylase D